MVGFFAKPAIEGELGDSIDPPDRSNTKPTGSFFSFDSIGEWFRDNHPTIQTEVNGVEIGDFGFGGFEMGEEGDDGVENPGGFGELVVDGSGAELKVGVDGCKKLGALSCSVEKDLGNEGNAGVSGSSSSGSSGESSEESESESAASSSSEESDSDDDREEVKAVGNVEAEVEEGEILEDGGKRVVSGEDEEDDDVDNMVTWSDVDEEEEGVGSVKPIRSKNELADLPPVPPVDVELQPNHQMLPVGVVLSIIGAKVIVEGVEQHNPLSEGSILWITEKRSPLGLIDEIFGPVKNPYYVVRYNSETEVPAGLQDGSMISFVSEFANHVLDDKSLYKKGYDASGDNDEEVTDDAEFSDDEKEAEYKRMQKSSKRGLNDQNLGNGRNRKKKGTNKDRQSKNDKSPLQADQSQHNVPPRDLGNNSSVPRNGQAGDFPQMQYEQPQGTVFPGGFPAQAMPWLLQNLLQNNFQMGGMPMPFQQQFDPTQRSPCYPPVGQPGFFPGPACPPWGGYMGQNTFNQAAFGMMGSQGQQLPQSNPNGTQMGQNRNFQPPNVIPGNGEAPGEFNQGPSYGSGRGRGQHQRGGGGGRRGGGRGRQQSR